MSLTIKMKLVLLCGLGLSLVAAVLVVGVYFNGQIDVAHNERIDIQLANEHVQEARIAENAYLQFYKPEFITERANHSDLALKEFVAVAEQSGLDLSALQSQLREYDSAFVELVEMHTQTGSLVRRWIPDLRRSPT